jgi:hypothetical protein
VLSTPTSAMRPGRVDAVPIQKAEEDAVWSNINWRVVPIILILIAYIMAFPDRISVGYAKLTMPGAVGPDSGCSVSHLSHLGGR